MAKTKYLFACIFLLALTIGPETMLTEARHLKLKNKRNHDSCNCKDHSAKKQIGDKSSQTFNLNQNALAGQKFVPSMPPSQNPDSSGKNNMPQGHSPGVGHPFVQSAEKSKRSGAAKSNSSDNKTPKVDDSPYDYSPGVGHAFVEYDKDTTKPDQELLKKKNGSQRKHFIEADKLLAHSPGVGHAVIHSEDNVKPRH